MWLLSVLRETDDTNVVSYMRSLQIHHIYLVLCLCYLFSYKFGNNLSKERGVYKCNTLAVNYAFDFISYLSY